MNEFHTIPTFSKDWWVYTTIVFFSLVTILYFFGKQKEVIKNSFAIVLSIFAFILVFSLQAYFIFSNSWTASASLPLHLCSISKILGAIILLKFNQSIFEFVLLLGIGGALQSIFTPQLEIPVSTFALLEYYMSHAMIILMPLYLLHVQGHRVRKNAWWKSFLIGIILLSIVGVINHFLNSNYIYLCTRPEVDNPLLIGPWPFYLSGFLVFGFMNISLFFLLFSWWGRKLDNQLH